MEEKQKMHDELIDWLSKEIEGRGWSHRELARRANISQAAVSTVLKGQRKAGWEFCAAVAQAFNEAPETVLRLAGLLPKQPEAKNDTTLTKLWDLVHNMSVEQRQEVFRYAKYRYQLEQEEKQKRQNK